MSCRSNVCWLPERNRGHLGPGRTFELEGGRVAKGQQYGLGGGENCGG